MPVYGLTEDPALFPDPQLADADGLLAMGGDLSAERLIGAYATGIFPWFEDGQPILWWSPDPRMVLDPAQLHVPKSLAKVMRSGRFELRFDTAFEQVIDRCATKRRPGQRGTWITTEMRGAYQKLHQLGVAHSAEAWSEGKLVGGLYGVSLGGAFFGESMFADAPDASKFAFVALVRQLQSWGVDLIDCQVTTAHLARFGAVEIPRAAFLARLQASLKKPTHQGRWKPEPLHQD
ncbi:MAG: leucyl/phenylalanyl-tRNA--protein transferase [Deltaproteobacteria bacterium]|nr:leucyl/phenylalanyl-tRNA--protein transferase [Deltaproteobacteria bacterium]